VVSWAWALLPFGAIRNPRWPSDHFLILLRKNCMLFHQTFQKCLGGSMSFLWRKPQAIWDF
jgi:hypothetical protein